MTTFTNDFHNREISIRKNVGDTVSASTLRRVRQALCGIEDCTCSGYDGTRHSRYSIANVGTPDAPVYEIMDSHAR